MALRNEKVSNRVNIKVNENELFVLDPQLASNPKSIKLNIYLFCPWLLLSLSRHVFKNVEIRKNIRLSFRIIDIEY